MNNKPYQEPKLKSLNDQSIYNMGIRDALKEVAKWDGLIPSASERQFMVDTIMKRLSCVRPEQKPIRVK